MRFAFISLQLSLLVLGAAAGELRHEATDDFKVIAESLSMPDDLNGFHHIGDDGVMRVFNEAGKVVDYAPLTRDQLLDFITTHQSILTPAEQDHLTQLWSAADGSQVSMEQIWQPPKDLLPKMLVDQKEHGLKQKQQLVNTTPVVPPAGLQKRRPEYCKRFRCKYAADCRLVDCLNCYHYDGSDYGTCG
ncbi:hypothetical protein EMCG_03276 [[Emmonsia] crescens]|uniref:Uncharacterized protein n=1 Tax=[Emmonsia] crescens TaxID=73230 RepID=A0A0G2J0G1_9EURO|nr:hypothetical protein EMCG_03276 [Emmonsia crescens UAMH 3008]